MAGAGVQGAETTLCGKHLGHEYINTLSMFPGSRFPEYDGLIHKLTPVPLLRGPHGAHVPIRRLCFQGPTGEMGVVMGSPASRAGAGMDERALERCLDACVPACGELSPPVRHVEPC